MSTVAVVVIAAIGAVVYHTRAQARHRSLRQRFGPEYDRALKSHESTREAERELLARKKRHDELEIHPLDPAARERHLAEWRQVQERFVDEPGAAVIGADRLLILVMGERGYPTEGYEQQVADLSVEHADAVDRYRKAHDIRVRTETKKVSTEDLRQAMMHYRALFDELLKAGAAGAAADGHGLDRTATEANGAGPGRAEPANRTAARLGTADQPAGVTGRRTARRDVED